MKGANLIKLRDAGIRVPPFIVLSGDALDRAAAGDCPLPGGEGRLYAVRSSCSAEDGSELSFAGIFETYLDVEPADIPACIRDCAASLRSTRALEYMALRGVDPDSVRMDVIVQQMAYGACSGILFTANPRGILNEAVVTVGAGRGDLVVGDRIDTTSYFYHKTDRCCRFEGREDLLAPEMIEALVGLGDRIAAVLGIEYADIEFVARPEEEPPGGAPAGARAAGEDSAAGRRCAGPTAGGPEERIDILQARPITGLRTDRPIVYDNSNIVESYPGVTLPLTDSFARMIYTGVFRGVSARVLRDRRLVASLEDTFAAMVGSVAGRMYYRIDNWYRILRYLPFSSRIIPVWQEMLGVRTKTYDESLPEIGVMRRLRTHLNFLWELIRVPAGMKKLERRFDELSRYFWTAFRPDRSGAELRALFEEMRDKLLAVWDITLLNDMYAFLFTGLLKRGLRRRYPDTFEERAVEFITGIVHIESMKPVYALAELAALREKNPGSPEYREARERYLHDYGDRTVEELKLESRTFRTNPELLDIKLREGVAPLRREENRREAGRGERRPGFFARRAILGIRNREISRLNRCRIFGMVRALSHAFGALLAREGVIAEASDVFYLRFDEVFDRIEDPKDARELVKRRRAEYEDYRELPTFNRLVLTGPEVTVSRGRMRRPERAQDSAVLYGTACSGGAVTGEVVVVTDAASADDVRGKIIVARMTDPGWVFLLSGSRGIVTEKGSLLSHTAIISRELGIPAVVGVDGVTEILRTGDRIALDGNAGTVEIQR